jgi:uncharacterized membrane protein
LAVNNSSTGLPENVASTLCYAFGFVSGVVFLIVERRSRLVRFHAMQSLMAFGLLAIAGLALQVIPALGTALGFVLNIFAVALWIVCMVQAWQGRRWKLPIVGDEAEKQADRMVP